MPGAAPERRRNVSLPTFVRHQGRRVHRRTGSPSVASGLGHGPARTSPARRGARVRRAACAQWSASATTLRRPPHGQRSTSSANTRRRATGVHATRPAVQIGSSGRSRRRPRRRARARGASRGAYSRAEYTRVTNKVAAWWRDDADESAQECDRLEHQMRAAVGPWSLELIRDAAVMRPRPSIERERRARAVVRMK